MSDESLSAFGARLHVREAAVKLARSGMSAETVLANLLDMARTEAARALDAIAEEDRRMAIADDRADFAEECRNEHRRRDWTRTGT